MDVVILVFFFLILGQTPLHVAARLKKYEIFQYLHQNVENADIAQKDFNGKIYIF